ncbi:MAG: hypothetical protein LBJ13_02665, partial [Puniceicoccales bacterium]|nr:hypothetical protein [Puniceicoccales bacterium]
MEQIKMELEYDCTPPMTKRLLEATIPPYIKKLDLAAMWKESLIRSTIDFLIRGQVVSKNSSIA